MKNEYNITKNLMKSWANDFYFVSGASVFYFIASVALGLVGVALVIILIISQLQSFLLWLCGILYICISLEHIFFGRIIACVNRYKRCVSLYGSEEWLRSIEFLDDEIKVKDASSVTVLKYDGITRIKEKNNTVLIVFGKSSIALRVYKDAFSNGSWEECKALLDTKKK